MDTFAPFAPTVVSDHLPSTSASAPVGLRSLIDGALGRSGPSGMSSAMASLNRVEAIAVFDFGAGRPGRPSRVNVEIAESLADTDIDLPMVAQHESAEVLARRGKLVIDLDAMARASLDREDGSHIDTACVAATLAGLVDRAGWTSIGIVAHPAHIARCVATCQRLGLRVVPVPVVLDSPWDQQSRQWWTRRRAAWATREVAVIAHQMVTGRVLLRF